MDRHGRVLVPSELRRMLNLQPGDKVTLEVSENEVKILNSNKIIDEMHAIFTKARNVMTNSAVDDSVNSKSEEYQTEEMEDTQNVQ